MNIGENSIVTLTYGALIFIVATSISLIGWISSIEFRGTNRGEAITELKMNTHKVGEMLYGIDKRLSRIEIMLEKQK